MDKKVADKVLKLLKLAERNGNEHQAEAARKKAVELMAEYEIDESDLRRTRFVSRIHEVDYKSPPSWYTRLWSAVAAFVGVSVAHVSARGGRKGAKAKVILIGHEPDIENTVYMVEALRSQIERLTAEFRDNPLVVRRHTNGYRHGLVSRMWERMEELTAAVVDKKQEEGLVPVSQAKRRGEQARDIMEEQLDVKKAETPEVDAAGFDMGHRDGDKLRLHKATEEADDSHALKR